MTVRARLGLVLVPVLLAPGAALALPGEDFQINSYTTNAQDTAAVAGSDGRFLVVWESNGSLGGDPSGDSVRARRVNVSADESVPLFAGDSFQVSTYTLGDQGDPDVAAGADGGFTVVYQSICPAGTCVYGRRVSAADELLGTEFAVPSYTGVATLSPSVASQPDGAFVVVWQSQGSQGSDSSGSSIQARRFDPAGGPLGGQFQVNSYTTSAQIEPAVVFASDSSFVVAFSSYGSAGTDSNASGNSVQARRFSTTRGEAGLQFQVNEFTADFQDGPELAAGPNGNVYMVWESYGQDGGFDDAVVLREIDATDTLLGSELVINTFTSSNQRAASVASRDDGEFVVAWQSYGTLDDDTEQFSIQARRFGSYTDPTEFQVNTYTPYSQQDPEVALDGDGNMLVVWSYPKTGQGNDVYARAVPRGIFSDDFETGQSDRWDDTVSPVR